MTWRSGCATNAWNCPRKWVRLSLVPLWIQHRGFYFVTIRSCYGCLSVFVWWIPQICSIPAVSQWGDENSRQIGLHSPTSSLSHCAFFFFPPYYRVMAEHKEEEQSSFIVRLILELLSPGGGIEEEEWEPSQQSLHDSAERNPDSHLDSDSHQHLVPLLQSSCVRDPFLSLSV